MTVAAEEEAATTAVTTAIAMMTVAEVETVTMVAMEDTMIAAEVVTVMMIEAAIKFFQRCTHGTMAPSARPKMCRLVSHDLQQLHFFLSILYCLAFSFKLAFIF